MNRLAVLLLGVFPLLSGCNVPAAYVDADASTYHVIAPEFRAYLEADPSLPAEKKARRIRLLESWRARLEEAQR